MRPPRDVAAALRRIATEARDGYLRPVDGCRVLAMAREALPALPLPTGAPASTLALLDGALAGWCDELRDRGGFRSPSTPAALEHLASCLDAGRLVPPPGASLPSSPPAR